MIQNRRAWTLLAVVVLITAVSGSCLAGVFKTHHEYSDCPDPRSCRRINGYGSAICIGRGQKTNGSLGYIGLTVAHNYSSENTISKSAYIRQTRVKVRTRFAVKADLALMEFDWPRDDLHISDIGKSDPVVGDRVYYCGWNPASNGLIVNPGDVTSVRGSVDGITVFTAKFERRIVSGNSGGGIYADPNADVLLGCFALRRHRQRRFLLPRVSRARIYRIAMGASHQP